MSRARLAPSSAAAEPALFVPHGGDGEREQQAQYEQLRAAAGSVSERTPSSREIYRMQCRLGGRNCIVEVGKPMPGGEQVVAAIFDVGGDERYLVYGVPPVGELLLRIGKRSVYDVLEFA